VIPGIAMHAESHFFSVENIFKHSSPSAYPLKVLVSLLKKCDLISYFDPIHVLNSALDS